ncbi:TPA: hypothetical protein DIC40_01715 [Patescibacteria group bacterium]|nr:hypothetical protein P148_SR1C00001G0310 [candidate division SR1 bacterium RAAC1_SR1_1]HCY20577.1 hypothetical protein [Candidatus Gracilibacteria bacterium]
MDDTITQTKRVVIVSIANETILEMEYFIHRVDSKESPLVYANPPDIEHFVYELQILQIKGKQGNVIEPKYCAEIFELQKTLDNKTYVLYNKTPIYNSIDVRVLVSVYSLCLAANVQTGEIILGNFDLNEVRCMLISKYHFDILKKN